MGTWGYDPNIPLPDAETRFRLRWANWHQVQGRQRVVIAARGDHRRGLAPGHRRRVLPRREPRARGTFDSAFTARGLAVYHVDRTVKLARRRGPLSWTGILDCVELRPVAPVHHEPAGRRQVRPADRAQEGALDYEDDLFRDGDSLAAD